MKKHITWVSLLAALFVAVAVPLTADGYRGDISVLLDHGPNQFVLDQPASEWLVVHNGTNIAMRNGWAKISPLKYIYGTPTGCIKSTLDGGSCKFRIRLLKAGKTAKFKVTFIFTSEQFPDGVFPGTKFNYVRMNVQAYNKVMYDQQFANLYFVKAPQQ